MINLRLKVLTVDPKNPTEDEKEKATEETSKLFLAGLFITSSNQKKYGVLNKELHSAQLRRGGRQLTEVVKMLNLMLFNDRSRLNTNHLYLSNCLMVTATKNKKDLKNIQEVDVWLDVG